MFCEAVLTFARWLSNWDKVHRRLFQKPKKVVQLRFILKIRCCYYNGENGRETVFSRLLSLLDISVLNANCNVKNNMDGKQDCSSFPQCIPVKSGNRTEWNQIRSVMIRIGWPRRRSRIVLLRVNGPWRDTKILFCRHGLNIGTNSETKLKISWFSK